MICHFCKNILLASKYNRFKCDDCNLTYSKENPNDHFWIKCSIENESYYVDYYPNQITISSYYDINPIFYLNRDYNIDPQNCIEQIKLLKFYS